MIFTGNGGSNSVLINGSGTVVLGGANTFSFGVTLSSSGNLRVTNSAALGTFTFTFKPQSGTPSSGTLQLTGGIVGVTGPLRKVNINTESRQAPDFLGTPYIENLSGTNSLAAQVRMSGIGGTGVGILSTAGTLMHGRQPSGGIRRTANFLPLRKWRWSYISGPINDSGIQAIPRVWQEMGSGTWTRTNSSSGIFAEQWKSMEGY